MKLALDNLVQANYKMHVILNTLHYKLLFVLELFNSHSAMSFVPCVRLLFF